MYECRNVCMYVCMYDLFARFKYTILKNRVYFFLHEPGVPPPFLWCQNVFLTLKKFSNHVSSPYCHISGWRWLKTLAALRGVCKSPRKKKKCQFSLFFKFLAISPFFTSRQYPWHVWIKKVAVVKRSRRSFSASHPRGGPRKDIAQLQPCRMAKTLPAHNQTCGICLPSL